MLYENSYKSKVRKKLGHNVCGWDFTLKPLSYLKLEVLHVMEFSYTIAFTNQQTEYLQLEPILTDVSKTGVVRFPWKQIQPLLRYKLKSVLEEAYGRVNNIPDDDKDLSRQLLERFDKFKEYEIYI